MIEDNQAITDELAMARQAVSTSEKLIEGRKRLYDKAEREAERCAEAGDLQGLKWAQEDMLRWKAKIDEALEQKKSEEESAAWLESVRKALEAAGAEQGAVSADPTGTRQGTVSTDEAGTTQGAASAEAIRATPEAPNTAI